VPGMSLETDQLLGIEITSWEIVSTFELLQCENGTSETGRLPKEFVGKKQDISDVIHLIYRDRRTNIFSKSVYYK
jgi:hypothetical protein